MVVLVVVCSLPLGGYQGYPSRGGDYQSESGAGGAGYYSNGYNAGSGAASASGYGGKRGGSAVTPGGGGGGGGPPRGAMRGGVGAVGGLCSFNAPRLCSKHINSTCPSLLCCGDWTLDVF